MNQRCILTETIIRREYARTHTEISDDFGDTYARREALYQQLVSENKFKYEDFPEEDLRLSLDDFSIKQGWMNPHK